MRVYYDIQALPMPSGWPVVIAILVGIGLYLLFYTKIRKSRETWQVKVYNAIVALLLLVAVLVFFTKKEQGAELEDILLKYERGEYLSTKGELHNLNNSQGFDEFSISKQQFWRYLPNRQIPQYGCWKEYISTKKQLEGKKVEIDYIIFPNFAKTPLAMGDEKVDQMCILRFEVLE